MSADNWAFCPQCVKKAEIFKEKEIKKANQSYGKVTPEEYLDLRKAAETPVDLEQTFREDYSIGVDGKGGFIVDYSGSCKVCGLKYSYKYVEQIKFQGVAMKTNCPFKKSSKCQHMKYLHEGCSLKRENECIKNPNNQKGGK